MVIINKNENNNGRPVENTENEHRMQLNGVEYVKNENERI